MNTEGMTVLLTTHYIEEAEALCHRVGLINQGQLIALGSPGELLQRIGEIVVEYTVDGSTKNKFFPNREEAMTFVAGIKGNVLIREGNLEDVFVELTNRKVAMSGAQNSPDYANGHATTNDDHLQSHGHVCSH